MIDKQAHAQISIERPALEPFFMVDLKVCFLASNEITNSQVVDIPSSQHWMKNAIWQAPD